MRVLNRQTVAIGAAFIIAVGLGLGCGDDDDNGNGGGGGPGGGGSSSLTVSGEVEGDFSGFATYTDASLENNSFSVALTDNSKFHIQLRIGIEGNSPPPVGTYDVGGSIISSEDFHAIYSDFEEGGMMDPDEYSTQDTPSGTVELTSSSDDAVSGTFEFYAGSLEDPDQITVTNGEFQAVQVESGM